jgi:hypothetical protein
MGCCTGLTQLGRANGFMYETGPNQVNPLKWVFLNNWIIPHWAGPFGSAHLMAQKTAWVWNHTRIPTWPGDPKNSSLAAAAALPHVPGTLLSSLVAPAAALISPVLPHAAATQQTTATPWVAVHPDGHVDPNCSSLPAPPPCLLPAVYPHAAATGGRRSAGHGYP